MLSNIVRGHSEIKTHLVHEFKTSRDSCYSFPVESYENNVIKYKPMENGVLDSLRKCLSGQINATDCGIKTVEYVDKTYTHGTCTCGRIVETSAFTNECECGKMYNWSGQELAPKEFWGEETGESLADIEGPNAAIEEGR